MAEEHQNKSHNEYETTSPVVDEVESKDRGLFDFLGKKKDEDKSKDEDVIAEEFQQVHVSEPHKADHAPEPYKADHHVPEPYKADHHVPEPYKADHHVPEPYKADVPEPYKGDVPEPYKADEEEKKPSLLEKLHRSGSSSSSSSSDEEEGVEKKKKKKGLKEKIFKGKKTDEDTNVPIEKYDEAVPAEEKKGFLEKIKEKLPHKKAEETTVAGVPAPPPAVAETYAPAEEAEAKEKKGFMEKIKEKLPGYHAKTSEEEKDHIKY